MKWLLANVHSKWFSVKKISVKLAYKEFQVLFKDKCSIKFQFVKLFAAARLRLKGLNLMQKQFGITLTFRIIFFEA